MADDKTNTGEQDRSRVSGGQDYEFRDFAEQHGISVEQAQQLISEHGNNRAALDEAASQMNG
ncbi:DUF3606 domain-containing protein [Novosphingobium sp. Gsoil 351]|uniref:DUF3606 domain-containing protein n=1 Tax=Novosphingobium sp. Gsoil 351 TaxID=2675225 RepID=UPI0012B4BF3A|nr:DUF3606 domain-containing protein [Novosphingobium sp. Gsoil 351]QGN55793.1 DUF3606 domain-containing protein [Novosphingobium sp. Gsoil 351]